MATPDHTPHGRGYAEGLNYFNHDNDYWTSKYTDESFACPGVEFFTDLWLSAKIMNFALKTRNVYQKKHKTKKRIFVSK